MSAMRLSSSFAESKAPLTDRRVLQLTQGPGCAYPLYYFISSFTRDATHLVYHYAEGGELQLHRLELATGRSVQLTRAKCADTQWRPWCVDSGRGVLDHRSVLNVERDLVVYFDGNDVRTVDVNSLDDRPLFSLPADREAYGQNCVTPDGNWLVYIRTPRGNTWGKPCRDAQVVAYHFDSQEQRVLCSIDSAVFHVTAYDNEHFIVTPPADHAGMLLTDLHSGRISELREGDPGAQGHLVHCHATRRGVSYEVPEIRKSGLYDPFQRRRFEFPLDSAMCYVHTGRDPEGRLWFYENSTAWDSFQVHDMYALMRVDHVNRRCEWLPLTGTWPTYSGGQKAHFHPQLTPDRNWILFTGGDPRSQSTHMFLLDVSDLPDTEGIAEALLTHDGSRDL